MSSTLRLGKAYDATNLVIEAPLVKVQSSMIGSGLYLPETTITLRYVRGMFDGEEPTFPTECAVELFDNWNVLFFSGKVKSAKIDAGRVTLSCNSTLADYLGGILNFERVNQHPATILADLLDEIGIAHQGLMRFVGRYPLMLASAIAPSSANVKAFELIGSLIDMLTMDLAIENDTLVAFDRTTPYTGYQIEHAMSYPTLSDDGSSRAFFGVKFPYVYDGEVDMELGDTAKTTWGPDFSNAFAVQCIGADSAQTIAAARLVKYGQAHPVYQLKVRKDVAPITLGCWYLVNQGPLLGNYRTVGYQTDGEVFWLDLEAE